MKTLSKQSRAKTSWNSCAASMSSIASRTIVSAVSVHGSSRKARRCSTRLYAPERREDFQPRHRQSRRMEAPDSLSKIPQEVIPIVDQVLEAVVPEITEEGQRQRWTACAASTATRKSTGIRGRHTTPTPWRSGYERARSESIRWVLS